MRPRESGPGARARGFPFEWARCGNGKPREHGLRHYLALTAAAMAHPWLSESRDPGHKPTPQDSLREHRCKMLSTSENSCGTMPTLRRN